MRTPSVRISVKKLIPLLEEAILLAEEDYAEYKRGSESAKEAQRKWFAENIHRFLDKFEIDVFESYVGVSAVLPCVAEIPPDYRRPAGGPQYSAVVDARNAKEYLGLLRLADTGCRVSIPVHGYVHCLLSWAKRRKECQK